MNQNAEMENQMSNRFKIGYLIVNRIYDLKAGSIFKFEKFRPRTSSLSYMQELTIFIHFNEPILIKQKK